MAAPTGQPLLPYYERELRYLRLESARFAQDHPHAAGRLRLTGHESPDPHVERLLESFAFLTGRIQRRIDTDRLLVPAALLAELDPQLTAPIPSVAVVEAVLDPRQARPPGSVNLPAGAMLEARAPRVGGGQARVRWRVAYPLTLQPFTGGALESVDLADVPCLADRREVAGALRVRLTCQGQVTFAALGSPRLRLFLDVDPLAAGACYEALAFGLAGVVVTTPGGGSLLADCGGEGGFAPAGFAEEDAVLPQGPRVNEACRLVQELFACPRKFQFFDLASPAPWGDGREVDLVFLLHRPLKAAPGTRLLTNCTMAVNLYPATSDPIRLDRTAAEHRLTFGGESGVEVHSVRRVSLIEDERNLSRLVPPFFGPREPSTAGRAPVAWWARREPAEAGAPGASETWLSFVDEGFGPATPDAPVLFAQAWCTDGQLPLQMQDQTALEAEVALPVTGLRCLGHPSAPVATPLHGEALWSLVSSLTLNSLSLAEGPQALAAFREIVALYAHGLGEEARRQMGAIERLSPRPSTRRVRTRFGDGFVRGHAVTLAHDPMRAPGGNPALLMSVLDRVLALHAGVNSFTQLRVVLAGADGTSADTNGGDPWLSFPPRVGARAIL